MKKFIAAFLLATCLALATGPSVAHAAKFVAYPMVGVCAGTGVNLRDQPNTKGSEVLSVANKGNRFIVLGEQKVGSQVWYEIENPAPRAKWFLRGLALDIQQVCCTGLVNLPRFRSLTLT